MDPIKTLYSCDDLIEPLYDDLPGWFPEWYYLTFCDVAAILEGGCESGAWMPAVRYVDARKTMHKYGDEILGYLNDAEIGFSEYNFDWSSWSRLSCNIVSAAVELWCHEHAEALAEIVRGLEESSDGEGDAQAQGKV